MSPVLLSNCSRVCDGSQSCEYGSKIEAATAKRAEHPANDDDRAAVGLERRITPTAPIRPTGSTPLRLPVADAPHRRAGLRHRRRDHELPSAASHSFHFFGATRRFVILRLSKCRRSEDTEGRARADAWQEIRSTGKPLPVYGERLSNAGG